MDSYVKKCTDATIGRDRTETVAQISPVDQPQAAATVLPSSCHTVAVTMEMRRLNSQASSRAVERRLLLAERRRTAGEVWEHGPWCHLTNTNEYSLFRAKQCRSNMDALCSFDKSMCQNIRCGRTA